VLASPKDNLANWGKLYKELGFSSARADFAKNCQPCLNGYLTVKSNNCQIKSISKVRPNLLRTFKTLMGVLLTRTKDKRPDITSTDLNDV